MIFFIISDQILDLLKSFHQEESKFNISFIISGIPYII